MKMIVMDNFSISDPKNNPTGHHFVVENATLVPRVGDQIDFGYEPIPRVLTVAWDFANMTIYVVAK